MLKILSTLLVLFSFIASATAHGTKHDADKNLAGVQNDIEIFGRSLFLLRINEKQKFQVKIHNHIKAPCSYNVGGIEQAIADGLGKHGFKVVEDNAEFVVFVELFGGKNENYTDDSEQRCLGGYRVAFMQQHNGSAENEYVVKNYDYERATILMLQDGVFDAVYDDVLAKMKSEIVSIMHNMVLVIEDIRAHYKH